MNTDSRSLLSLVRHDYFRRIFCGWIGKKVEQKELPYDPELLTALTRAVCYENAKKLI
jgi:glucuronate isomerase